MNKIKENKLVVIVVIVVILLVIFGPKQDKTYQAVFLTNDQVYFCSLSGLNSPFPVLNDVFYLRVQQILQPSDLKNPTQQLQLVRMGSELHSPKDTLKISRDSIRFVEDLSADSQVVKAIDAAKAAAAAGK